jgi:hypothetical protein
MPVPDFQTVMLPLLESVSDGGEHTVSEAMDLLADGFELTLDKTEHRAKVERSVAFSGSVVRTLVDKSIAYGNEGETRTHPQSPGCAQKASMAVCTVYSVSLQDQITCV